jgi:hypothetical protein
MQDGDEADIRAITPQMLHGQVDAPYVVLLVPCIRLSLILALLGSCRQRRLATLSPILYALQQLWARLQGQSQPARSSSSSLRSSLSHSRK